MTVAVDLGHPAEGAFAKSLYCKATRFSPFFHPVPLGRKLLCEAHAQGVGD